MRALTTPTSRHRPIGDPGPIQQCPTTRSVLGQRRQFAPGKKPDWLVEVEFGPRQILRPVSQAGIGQQQESDQDTADEQATGQYMDAAHPLTTLRPPQWFRYNRITQMIGDAEMRFPIPIFDPWRDFFHRKGCCMGEEGVMAFP